MGLMFDNIIRLLDAIMRRKWSFMSWTLLSHWSKENIKIFYDAYKLIFK